MTSYILRLGENITLSIVSNNQLVYHLLVGNLAELPNYINDIKVDELIVIAQGTTTSEIKDNSYRLSSFTKSGEVTHFIMPDRDLVFLTELCNSNKIDKLCLHSYLDFVCHKFRREDKIIVVDNYLDKYVSIYLEEGEIKDLYRSTESKLAETLNYMKREYNARIVNVKNNVDSLLLLSQFKNFKRIPKEILFSLDHIPYVKDKQVKSLINNSDIVSLSELWSDGEDSDISIDSLVEVPEAIRKQKLADAKLKKPARPIKKKLHSREYSMPVAEEIVVNMSDVIVNICITAFFLLAAVGLYINFVFSEKVEILKADVEVSQLRSENSNGSSTEKAIDAVSSVYSNLKGLNVSSCSYDNGEVSITTLSEDEKSKDDAVTVVEKSYPASEHSFMGAYTLNGKSYEKTKFLLSAP